MPLLNLTDIRRRLDELFLPIEPDITGFRLVESKTSSADLAECEQILGTSFPETFKQLLLEFDFGNLTIGPIAFCNEGDYADRLLFHNKLFEDSWIAWWGKEQRPTNLILIANSDPYAILLDTKSQAILALEHGQTWQQNAFLIADDFRNFLRGIGTVFLERVHYEDNNDLADNVALDVGAKKDNPFWRQLAE